MGYKITRHTPFPVVYLYIDASKALRKVDTLLRQGDEFTIADARTEMAMTRAELEKRSQRAR